MSFGKGVLDMFNHLLIGCIERHAPLKQIKVSRRPAPWIKDLEISKLKQSFHELRYMAHQSQKESVWDEFRLVRNNLKREIKKQKKAFYRKALNSKRPSELWSSY